jgi:hypothetical protein
MSAESAEEGGAAVAGGVGGFFVGGPMGAVAGAGIGMSVAGQLNAASSQSDVEKEKAAAAAAQAQEVAQREAFNDVQAQDQTFKSKLDFASSFASSGKQGAGIGSQLEIQRQSDLAIKVADEQASFQESMLRQGGSLDTELAGQYQEAGDLNAAGTILAGAGKMAAPSFGASNYNAGGTTSLPSLPSNYTNSNYQPPSFGGSQSTPGFSLLSGGS